MQNKLIFVLHFFAKHTTKTYEAHSLFLTSDINMGYDLQHIMKHFY